MSNKPNNFPREGQHNTITKAALDKLEAERPKHNKTLDYTIGGTIETQVHSNVEASRNYALRSGHKRIREISDKLQTDHVFASNKGHAKAQLNAASKTQGSYAERQRKVARNQQTPAQMKSR